MMVQHDDVDRWQAICDVEKKLMGDMLSAWSGINEKTEVLRRGLRTAHHRGTALRLLMLLGDQPRKEVFPELVRLASVGHSDIDLCRLVIKALPFDWVVANIEAVAKQAISDWGAEEYRRLAELYCDVDVSLLQRLLAEASHSDDAEIREVGRDFTRVIQRSS